MQSIEFQLNGGHEFIELCNLLKLTGIASSGGQGKLMVSNGDVLVPGLLSLPQGRSDRGDSMVPRPHDAGPQEGRRDHGGDGCGDRGAGRTFA